MIVDEDTHRLSHTTSSTSTVSRARARSLQKDCAFSCDCLNFGLLFDDRVETMREVNTKDWGGRSASGVRQVNRMRTATLIYEQEENDRRAQC